MRTTEKKVALILDKLITMTIEEVEEQIFFFFNRFPKMSLLLHVCTTENTVGKGEIAHNKQFLFFSKCFLPFWRTVCHIHCRLQSFSV